MYLEEVNQSKIQGDYEVISEYTETNDVSLQEDEPERREQQTVQMISGMNSSVAPIAQISPIHAGPSVKRLVEKFSTEHNIWSENSHFDSVL